MVNAQAPRRIPDQPCVDCLEHSLGAESTAPAVPRQVAFWLLAFVLTATMLGTTCRLRCTSSTKNNGISRRPS
jgi:hypothetical protein